MTQPPVPRGPAGPYPGAQVGAQPGGPWAPRPPVPTGWTPPGQQPPSAPWPAPGAPWPPAVPATRTRRVVLTAVGVTAVVVALVTAVVVAALRPVGDGSGATASCVAGSCDAPGGTAGGTSGGKVDPGGATAGTAAPTGEVPPGLEDPGGLGDDDALNRLARQCFDGNMAACDFLYVSSEPDTDYEAYASSCAGRQPADAELFCTDAFPSD